MKHIIQAHFDYTILKVYSTISKSFATELVDEEYIQPVMNQLNLYRGIYDENGNLFYEGHRFFWIKVHIKYLGETTSKFQFTSTIIAEYPDGTTYELGGINFIDRSLAENNEQHLAVFQDRRHGVPGKAQRCGFDQLFFAESRFRLVNGIRLFLCCHYSITSDLIVLSWSR